nr:hypothetical protein [Rhodococcus fascians]
MLVDFGAGVTQQVFRPNFVKDEDQEVAACIERNPAPLWRITVLGEVVLDCSAGAYVDWNLIYILRTAQELIERVDR